MTRPAGEQDREVFRDQCYRCFKPVSHCLCDRIRCVANRTRITIFQHPRERFHAIGTARIARLGLANARIEVPPPRLVPGVDHPFEVLPRAGLLFPSDDALGLETLPAGAAPDELIVLDGTWSQARALHRQNPWLDDLPHYRLEPAKPTRYRIRRAPRAQFVSTLEAIVQALEVIEPETAGLDSLLAVFDEMIDAQVVHQNRAPRRRVRGRAHSDG